MNRIAEEYPARRIQSFDTVLPDQVRVQFTNPRRPHKPGGPECRDGNTLWVAGAIAFAAIILGLAIGSLRRPEAQQIAAQASTTPVEQPGLAPTPSQIAAAPFAQRPDSTGPRPELAVAPRAELVRMPPPRAQLIRLPEWRIGEERPVMTPYGLEVSARLKGKLPSADMLPASGNAIGDAWVIGDTAWVWIAAPGAPSAKWIDP
ncbi:MAG: hypothetical protein JO170_26705 [Verrucomicrobia bacterium]|nr:hypothetical protein [Verrucomicrobiota bacterium]